jgi:hypothetical protein
MFSTFYEISQEKVIHYTATGTEQMMKEKEQSILYNIKKWKNISELFVLLLQFIL